MSAPTWHDLAKALTAEAKHGHQNLRGKQQTFAEYMSRSIPGLMNGLSADEILAWRPVISAFSVYPGLDEPHRKHAVARASELVARAREAAPPPPPDDVRDLPVQFVKGVGPKLAATLAKLGIGTWEELVRHYPRQYLDFAKRARVVDLQEGQQVTIWGTIKRANAHQPRPGLTIQEVLVHDGTGQAACRWFMRMKGKPNLGTWKARFPEGAGLLVSGEAKRDPYRGGWVFDRPEVEVLAAAAEGEGNSVHVGRIVPIYPLTEGLALKALRGLIKNAMDAGMPLLKETMPAALRDHLDSELAPGEKMWGLRKALQHIHFPESEVEQKRARERLAFEELFWMQLGLARKRAAADARLHAVRLPPSGELVGRLRELLPFRLTGAQERVFREISADMASPKPMHRLVQGDVGSGKTIVALLSLLVAVENGYQGAMMAPTEILAEQHFRKLSEWCVPLGVGVELLTGRMGARAKREALFRLASGEAKIAVGTHALIQDSVEFRALGLAVVDEQHRFGVRQRAALRSKGESPQILVMTATPIPRTLALTVHGDLDVSAIDELPPGRTPIVTEWARTPGQQEKTWQAIREQLDQGRQAYVVYPLIEASEDEGMANVRSAVEMHEELSTERFPDRKVGLLHGQLPSDEKDAVMERFRKGDLDILVATTVIEVGVDVPNATLMVIENAERFGLSQLHQLRGRVGRGAHASFCYLHSHSRGETTAARLGIMEQTNDGFVIAEQDLRLRGPGDFLGTRQSGLPDLHMADLVEDTKLLERARHLARELLSRDPELANWPTLRAELERAFKANPSFLEVG